MQWRSENLRMDSRFKDLLDRCIVSILYGSHQGKGIDYCRSSFIKQCHVSSLVQLELKSMMKSIGHYAVESVYYRLPKDAMVILYCYPSVGIHDSSSPSTVHASECTPGSIEGKERRL